MKKTFFGFAIIVFFILVIVGIHYGIYMILAQTNIFGIRRIDVTGNVSLDSQTIIAQSGLSEGVDIFSFDLLEVAARVIAHPSVEIAKVRRFPPDSIVIEIIERAPLAFVSDSTNFYLCDKNAKVLEKDKMMNLPVFYVDFTLYPENGVIHDEVVRAVLNNLSDYDARNSILTITLRQSEGFYIQVRDVGTLFFLGKSIPDTALLSKVESIASKIRMENMSVKYVDVNKENAIGYQ